MVDLPAPLVPADVDLRGFEFMPFYGDMMLGSRFNSTTNDTAWRIGVTLWWKSWNCQVPAASLPDDDGELAMLAGLGRDVKTFRKVRELALHGFVKCSDGRLYHRFLSQHAIEAWKGRQAHKLRTIKARIAAMEKRLQKAVTDADKAHISGLLQTLHEELKEAVTESVTDKKTVCNTVSQGEGQGQGEEKEKLMPPPDGGGVADAPPDPGGGNGIPDCPHDRIIALYHELLPTNPRVVTWNDTRRAHLRARWRERAKAERYQSAEHGLEDWRTILGNVARSRFLTGRKAKSGERPFLPNLAWLVKSTPFANIIEGTYHDVEDEG